MKDLLDSMKHIKSEPPKDNDEYRRYIANFARAVMSQASEEDLEFARRTDTDELGPFIEYLLDHQITRNPEAVYSHIGRSDLDEFMDYIMSEKARYGLPRPFDLARQYKVVLPFEHGAQTATCESYPSGHSAAAFYIAHLLSDQLLKGHPDRDRHRCELFNIANRIAWGRVCLGVHSIQDIKEGARLASLLFA